MKKIHQINQYLLERYPTIWNTKLLWFLLIGVIIHIIFFFLGYFSHSDPRSLQVYEVKGDYFKHGIFAFQVIISLLIIVTWLIMMFRNNAFKNFYPSSKAKLFAQFCHYFLIIFINITFYFSYMAGFKTFINKAYPEKEFIENVKVINKASAFLGDEINFYTLDNRKVPPFDQLFCETNLYEIDKNQKYYVYYKSVYQFYDLYSKTVTEKDKYGDFIEPSEERKLKKRPVLSAIYGKSKTFYYKNKVVDVSSYIKSSGLSYYNYSEVFYNRAEIIQINEYGDVIKTNSGSQVALNKQLHALLNEKNSQSIENLLSQFIKISDQYKISHNLDAKSWTKLVYYPEEFNVKYFIRNEDPKKVQIENDFTYYEGITESVSSVDDEIHVDKNGNIINDSIRIRDFNPEVDKQLSPTDFKNKYLTNYYYYNQDLKFLLQNVDTIKSYNYFESNIHIYLWLAFGFSLFVFSFRMMGLKSLIFSIITAGVLSLLVVFFTLITSRFLGVKEEFIASYFSLCLMLFVLFTSIFFIKKMSKLVMSIFVTLSLNTFVGLVFMILIIISLHQQQYFNTHKLNNTHQPILEYLDLSTSYLLLIIGFIFVYFYSGIIRNWKSRTE